MRKFGWVLGGLLTVLAIAIGLGIALFDPDAQKPRIIAAVKQATGRDLKIQGRIGLALSLRPTIEIADATLSNPPGFSRPDMLSIGKIDLQVALIPLLSKRIEIDRLIVSKPDVRLETDAKGNPNWVFTPPEKPVAAPSAAVAGSPNKAEPMAFAIGTLRLEDSIFSYRNGKSGQLDVVRAKRIETATAAIDAPLHLTAAFELEGTEITLTADTGPLARLTGQTPGDAWPVKLAVTAAGAKIGAEGTIADPLSGAGLNIALNADIPDLGALGKLAKMDLPRIAALVLSAKIAADPKGPAHGMALRDLKLASSVGDIAGDLAIVFGPPTGLTGVLQSQKIDLDALMPPEPSKGAATPGNAGATAAAGAKSKWLIPDRPLPFGQMQLIDGNLQAKIGTLRFGGADYKSIEAHAVLKDSVLTLDPAKADTPQGHVALTLTADAGKPAPPVHITLRAPGIALAPLLATLGEPAYATGNIEILADLHGSGESPHAIASSLNGMFGLAMAGGSIDTKRIAGAGSRVLEAANPQKGAGGASALRCFALRLDFEHGRGTAKAMTLGSALLNVDGTGSVDLGEETLALMLKSRASIGGAAVTVPIKVFGPMAAPQTKVDEVGIAQSNAAALGGLFGGNVAAALGGGEKPVAGDSCPAALALARGQAAPTPAPTPAPEPIPAAGPVPAPAQQVKPPNAGQLLKQLFH
ncbi:MAG: AsmA family protein [Rhodospirillales bacterium]